MVSKHHYDKISLSKRELGRIYKRLQHVTQLNLRLHLPNCSSVDPYRIDVENALNAHLAQTFDRARYALVVDGMDLEEANLSIESVLALAPHIEVEPYDPGLDAKLRNVLQQLEDLTVQVTRLRRELPLQARDAYEQLVATAEQELKGLLDKEIGADASEASAETDANGDPHIPPDVLSDLNQAIANLSHVRKTLPVQENIIRAHNQVYDFLLDYYNRQKLAQDPE
ncbi:Mis14-domain-containing protein [Metschnikowia bicuspidata]|uniref:Mis14-domain-containing protein n=1 Tax=Metschnikowia bicuspidata TaxID=27322 RepID=A0A4P9ZBC3_9ASCO|nr:Mis14-domain-containing protein [Metschnikowia bicuspidata]